METEVIRLDREKIDRASIEKAGEILRAGGLVAFPTETVYGLGGDGLNPESSKKIYAAKGRPSDNPLIVHISHFDAIYEIAESVPEAALRLAKEFWPGPMTIILRKSDRVPYETTGGLDTVAIRLPSDEVARMLIDAGGGYVAAPSANLSGRPSPTSSRYVEEDLCGRVEMILDGGDCQIGLESTIIDLSDEKPMILRPGYITEKMLAEVVGSVDMDRTILDGNCAEAPKAPGMKYRHYAPQGDLSIVKGERNQVVSYINEQIAEESSHGLKCGVIGTDETVGLYLTAATVKSVGSRADEDSIARELYRILREFDDEEVAVIYSESFDEGVLSMAIMNRLLKAAGHKVITLQNGSDQETEGDK